VLSLPKDIFEVMVAHCLDGYPLEACGLLAGLPLDLAGLHPDPGGLPLDGSGLSPDLAGLPPSRGGLHPDPGGPARVVRGYPTANAAASSRVFTVEPRDLRRADRDAESRGAELIGVWHSHTDTEAYPSPTDIAQAPDPAWHYVIISLRDLEPVLRSYRVVEGTVTEEQVEITDEQVEVTEEPVAVQ